MRQRGSGSFWNEFWDLRMRGKHVWQEALSFHEKWMREDTEHTLSNFTPPVCVHHFSLLLWQFMAAATSGKEGGFHLQFRGNVQHGCCSWQRKKKHAVSDGDITPGSTENWGWLSSSTPNYPLPAVRTYIPKVVQLINIATSWGVSMPIYKPVEVTLHIAINLCLHNFASDWG